MSSRLSPVELTRDLVRIDTVNPPGNEIRAAGSLAERLRDSGWSADLVEPRPGRASVIARLEGRDSTRLPICFTGHLDVVPIGTAAWSVDPFGGEISGERLYGRGASDMKSGVAAIVCAAAEVARWRNRRAGALLVLTAGEEAGCDGARELVELGLLQARAGALVVGEPTRLYPVTAHKGAFWARLVTRGKAAHGSMPELGENAIFKMLPVVDRLRALDLGPPNPLQGAPTVNVGVIRGGSIPNQVPDRCEVLVDVRTVAGLRHDDVRAALAIAAGDVAEVERLIDAPPVLTDAADPWVERIFELAAPYTGERPRARSINYFTDAAVLRPALGNPPTVICGPGTPELAHQTDEYAEVALIERAVDLYTAIAREWCVG